MTAPGTGRRRATRPAGRRRRPRRPAGRRDPDALPQGDGRRRTAAGIGDMVEQPAKVMRIGTMIKQLLEEVRAAPLDDASRNRLRDIHAASIRELEQGLAPELREELERITLPFTEGETPVGRRAADRPGPARRLAGGRLPRHPDGAVRPADGRPRAAGGDPPAGAAGRPGGQRRPTCAPAAASTSDMDVLRRTGNGRCAPRRRARAAHRPCRSIELLARLHGEAADGLLQLAAHPGQLAAARWASATPGWSPACPRRARRSPRRCPGSRWRPRPRCGSSRWWSRSAPRPPRRSSPGSR